MPQAFARSPRTFYVQGARCEPSFRSHRIFSTVYPSVIPPGMLHAVSTPTTAISGGSHFFTYETLALTAGARRCDHMSDQLDNDAGSSGHLYISLVRMAMALRSRIASKCRLTLSLTPSYLIVDISGENLVALYAMIQYPREFVPLRETATWTINNEEYIAGCAALRFLDYLGHCREQDLSAFAKSYITSGSLNMTWMGRYKSLWPIIVSHDEYAMTKSVVHLDEVPSL
jgi:hypothetical protein